jgi:uncharacterized DUF497 family protein
LYPLMHQQAVQSLVVAIVHSDRNDSIRIISARKATRYEQKIYFEEVFD